MPRAPLVGSGQTAETPYRCRGSVWRRLERSWGHETLPDSAPDLLGNLYLPTLCTLSARRVPSGSSRRRCGPGSGLWAVRRTNPGATRTRDSPIALRTAATPHAGPSTGHRVTSTYARKPSGPARTGPTRRGKFALKSILLRTSRPTRRTPQHELTSVCPTNGT
jgi:hypothetical protein